MVSDSPHLQARFFPKLTLHGVFERFTRLDEACQRGIELSWPFTLRTSDQHDVWRKSVKGLTFLPRRIFVFVSLTTAMMTTGSVRGCDWLCRPTLRNHMRWRNANSTGGDARSGAGLLSGIIGPGEQRGAR